MAAELTQQEIDYQIDTAIARSAEDDLSEPKANDVTHNKQSRRIIIHFDNDSTLSIIV